MPFLYGLKVNVLQIIDEECIKNGDSIYQLPYEERNALFRTYPVWDTPDHAYEEGIALACPICLKTMDNWSPDGKKRFIRHKRGEGNPLCEAVIKGKVYDITLGIDKLFGPDPNKIKKVKGTDIIPVRLKSLEDLPKSPSYFRQDPETQINGIPLHRIMLLEGSGKEKVKALFDLPSKYDKLLGIPETNGQIIMEMRNKTEQPFEEIQPYDKEEKAVFYNVWEIDNHKYYIYVDAHFHDELEFDDNGKAKDRLKYRILEVCALPGQHDEKNNIIPIYPNRTPILIKGTFRQKKRIIHYESADVLVFDVDVYSDWNIYACPEDMYKRGTEK